jgi:predicted Zn-dependent protease
MEEGFARGPLETTGLESLIRAARANLSPSAIANLSDLESRLEKEPASSERVPILEQLAGEWYRAGQPAISGIYAKEIAEEQNTEEAWSITATTFNICLKKEGTDEKTRQFCASQAEQAYQAAISLNPEDADNRINLALSYTDYPPRDNPMKGILLLRELEQKYPENPRVYITLAQLAIKTNQLEKAVERFETARSLDPDNPEVICPLARVYESLGKQDEAAILGARCQELVK